MKISDIVFEIDSEIARLRRVRELLADNPNGASTPQRKRRKLSAAARKRIGDAQRKRWAAQKKAEASGK